MMNDLERSTVQLSQLSHAEGPDRSNCNLADHPVAATVTCRFSVSSRCNLVVMDTDGQRLRGDYCRWKFVHRRLQLSPKRTWAMCLGGSMIDGGIALTPYCVATLGRGEPPAVIPRLPRAARHLRSAVDVAASRRRHIAQHGSSSREAACRRWHAGTRSTPESECPPARH
jgi:hypothetical protein